MKAQPHMTRPFILALLVPVAGALLGMLFLLILMFLCALPTWPHSQSWGHSPSGALGIVVVAKTTWLETKSFFSLPPWTLCRRSDHDRQCLETTRSTGTVHLAGLHPA